MHIRGGGGAVFKAIREIATSDKKDEFNHEMMSRRVDKISISKTPNELAEMDFDYVGHGAFPHLQDNSQMYAIFVIIGSKKRRNAPLKKWRM